MLKTPRRKILHVVRQYHPSVGGLEAYVAQLAKRQQAHSDVEILTLNRVFGADTTLPASEIIDGAPVMRVPFWGRRKMFLPFYKASDLDRYDVIHIHAADQLLDLTAMRARRRRVPYFVASHGLFFHTKDYLAAKKLYLKHITRRALRGADAVFAVSANDHDTMRAVGVDSILLRNPIEPLPAIEPESDDIVFIGRLSKNKRVDRLFPFLAALRRRRPGTILHVIGSDTEGNRPSLEAAARSHGVNNAVEFHGYVSHETLLRILARCRYTVSASEYEGFGLAVVEAMSAGLIPLLENNAAFADTIARSGVGAVTSFDQIDAALDAFLRLDASPPAREAARAFALTHSWDVVETTIEEAYEAALRKRTTIGAA